MPKHVFNSRLTICSKGFLIIALFMLLPLNPCYSVGINIGGNNSNQTQPDQSTSDEGISNLTDPKEDQRISKRLKEIYSNIQGLDKIKVEVVAGIVELSGEVLNVDAQKKAVELAKRVNGVVEVNDDIHQNSAIEKHLSLFTERMRSRLSTIVSYTPLALIALIIVMLFWYLGKFLTRWNLVFEKIAPNQFIADLFKQLIRVGFLIIGLLLGLEVLDAGALITSVLGIVGLVGLAIGFAIRDTIENYITSILLSLRQPFASNDYVAIEGFEGLVVRLTSRATILRSVDGNDIRIPNATVYKSSIVNFTCNPLRRFTFKIAINAQQDVDFVQQLVVDTLSQMEGIVSKLPCLCLIEDLSDSSITLGIYGWVDQNTADFGKVRSSAIQLLKKIFEEANVTVAETRYAIKLDKQSELSIEDSSGTEFLPKSASETIKKIGKPTGFKAIIENESTDILPDHSIEEGIDAERSQNPEANLLNASAPKE